MDSTQFIARAIRRRRLAEAPDLSSLWSEPSDPYIEEFRRFGVWCYEGDMHHACCISAFKSIKYHKAQIRMENARNEPPKGANSESRGACIVLEGLDRSGKTSQSTRLVAYLEGLGYSAELWRFPDRTTSVGQMISSYLSNESQLDDHTVHLLFSANRWEKRSLMEKKLKAGTSLIIDRYSFSGVAFSSAKGLDFDWCKAPEVGLLAPDLVLYLDIPPEKAAERGGYGTERYEKLEFQRKVADCYKVLRDPSWKVIDPQLPIEEISNQVQEVGLGCVEQCRKDKLLSLLWSS